MASFFSIFSFSSASRVLKLEHRREMFNGPCCRKLLHLVPFVIKKIIMKTREKRRRKVFGDRATKRSFG
jgi:hypothetical protein